MKGRKALAEKGGQNDIENQALLAKIIDKYGLPTDDWVSGFAATASFLTILHADNNPEFQKRGLELIEKAVNAGKMKEGYYVKLKKRISL